MLLALVVCALFVAWHPKQVGAATAIHENFKECHQSGFCTRQRAFSRLVDRKRIDRPLYQVKSILTDGFSGSVSKEHLAPSNGRLRAEVVDPSRENVTFLLEIEFLQVGSIRIRMLERQPLRPRFELYDDLVLEHVPVLSRETVTVENSPETVVMKEKINTVIVNKNPFSIRIARHGETLLVFNGKNYLNYEHIRNKEDDPPTTDEEVNWRLEYDDEEDEIDRLKRYLEIGKWEEEFKGIVDTKSNGPASIGFDLTFPNANNLYGLPEHAANFSLRTTRETNKPYLSDPFRLHNLDVFEYELDSPMSLYGSVPFVVAHGHGTNSSKASSVGVLWLNAAEMWVDIERNVKQSKPLFFQRNKEQLDSTEYSQGSTAHWMAESGILDLFVFTADSPAAATSMLTKTTGRPQLPPLFSIAYHQCRWNYNDTTDVLEVDKGFDVHGIPYDVIWLDIEHTDGKRYFTWDKQKFPDPVKLQETLAEKGRKMVTIIDPHIKKDDQYYVYKQFSEQELFVKAPNGSAYEGWCWPGNSNWIDFIHPDARRLWASMFKYENYSGSSKHLFTWNDMNEPSVFTGPERTLAKDSVHVNGYEHRDVHNIYGALQQRSSFEGHLLRSDGQERPFVLTRSFFAGSQRFGAVWTGDNAAKWGYLKASIPMLLSLGVGGISFAGADVGGFFGNPEPELAVRWYQAAAFQPFFRGHAHIDTKRREPWLFGEPYTSLIRKAISRRYQLLPYIYSLFWEAHSLGTLVMRPLLYEFPNDSKTWETENAFMLGSGLLIHPVIEPNATSLDIYLPTSDVWYSYETFERVPSGVSTIPVTLEDVPVFIRGGSILPRKDIVRASSAKSAADPYTIIIAADNKVQATGSLYVDDGVTYDPDTTAQILSSLAYRNGALEVTQVAGHDFNEGSFALRITRIVLIGAEGSPSESPDYNVTVGNGFIDYRFHAESSLLISRICKVQLIVF
ncbi:hypothetical protein HDU96_008437 [Phlyctochytrium bullatum]|nr:hypothetical protein HDU96_008437 [Phlyctochytrium bullatum]